MIFIIDKHMSEIFDVNFSSDFKVYPKYMALFYFNFKKFNVDFPGTKT